MIEDPNAIKYLIHAYLTASGVVEKPDVIGAIFGQTEGLLNDELDLRELQKSGRIGRIEANIESKKGRSEGEILIPSSLDKVETAVLAASLEVIDRVGPCKATIKIQTVEDVRAEKRQKIVSRAKDLITSMIEKTEEKSNDVIDSVRESLKIDDIISYGPDSCPAGPNVDSSDAIIVVEGRSDILNLLKSGIKNTIAVEGTNIPKTVQDLSREKITTAFLDGDRGGDLILKELFQTSEVDFIARAPKGYEVEELSSKQIMKALRSKMPVEQYIEMYGLDKTLINYKHSEKETKNGQHEVKNGDEHATIQEKPQQQQSVPAEKKYITMLNEIGGTLKALILDAEDKKTRELPVRDLAETLKSNNEKAETVVFDGIITQRLLDIAADKKIKRIVGVKMGNVIKQPTSVEVLTKEAA